MVACWPQLRTAGLAGHVFFYAFDLSARDLPEDVHVWRMTIELGRNLACLIASALRCYSVVERVESDNQSSRHCAVMWTVVVFDIDDFQQKFDHPPRTSVITGWRPLRCQGVHGVQMYPRNRIPSKFAQFCWLVSAPPQRKSWLRLFCCRRGI